MGAYTMYEVMNEIYIHDNVVILKKFKTDKVSEISIHYIKKSFRTSDKRNVDLNLVPNQFI